MTGWSARCAEGFVWSARCAEGFAIAAIIHKDHGAERAQSGLASASAGPLVAIARELAALPKAERRAAVRAITAPRAIAPRADQPIRALSLLAGLPGALPRDHARRVLAEAPLPRAGFRADARLLALLQRLAQPSEP